ncbi:unnamed protein product [Adineta ricciae]|uniref:Uncharacterized protein n=1 Tax=Adineta ricciae TaxID=249248 RepID=A0A814K2I9_ADIRI|nr:unnamed protein product [Adineta ricciae]
MFDTNPNRLFYDPSIAGMPMDYTGGQGMFMNQPAGMYPMVPQQRKPKASPLSRIPSLHLPAIILLGFSWLLQTLATFLPYWSTYSGISDSRAGLWSARNFNYYSIQNFYFPQPTDFPTVTDSIGFTGANTKAYLVTVQFLMTFNFVFMLIVLVLLIVDYIFSQQTRDRPWSMLLTDHNTSDTAIKYGLLLYILYVFIIFEFAAWITYVGSRHDNNWQMHVSFAFAVIISVFLFVVFVMYVLEFLKRFQKNRLKWDYWYGPYIEWAFFIYLSALLLLLIVICCPEWAYEKIDTLSIFAEIGLFKQCYLSAIYKKSASVNYCTLSDSTTNQAWVNATQAFMLMAYIFGMIILVVMVVFRKEFRHNSQGYDAKKVNQPTFTYIIAGLILFFCFIFTLIGISIFGGKVFPNSISVNWAYILAVFSMVLFLITGILFILDAVHSQKQTKPAGSKGNKSFFFPAPLSNRVLAMQPLLKPEPAWSPPPIMPPMMQSQPWLPPSPPWQPMYPPQQQQPIIMVLPPPQPNYPTDYYPNVPLTQATLANYYHMLNYPYGPSYPNNQGLMNYSPDNFRPYPSHRDESDAENYFTHMMRRHFLQQQRLNYNHERLLEKYSRLQGPRVSSFRTFGSSALPGRNYDDYLDGMRTNNRHETSLIGQSRARIGTSDDTYRWMGEESFEPLPRSAQSHMQHSRNELMPFVQAERFEPMKMYHHPVFGLTPAYIRPVIKANKKYPKKISSDESESIDHSGRDKETKAISISDISDVGGLLNHSSVRYTTRKKLKRKRSNPTKTKRSNSFGKVHNQSLHSPFANDNLRDESNDYEDLTFSVSTDERSNRLFSVDSKHRYDRLHSKPIFSKISQRISRTTVTEPKNNNSSPVVSKPSETISNPTILPSLSIPLAPSVSPTAPSTISSSPTPEVQTISLPLNMPQMSAQSHPATVSNSTVPYQKLSRITDKSVKTPSQQTNAISLASTTHAISSNSGSDNDDDDADATTKNRGRI